MHPEAIELRIVSLPMVAPFTAAHGSVSTRTVVLLRILHPDGEGWGECAALPEPTYSDEYVDDAFLTLRDHLGPALLAATGPVTAAGLADVFTGIQGHPMAKAAIELALLDLEGRARGISLAHRLGAHPPGPSATVPAGVALGLHDTPDALSAEIASRVAEGYGRIKMKIAPDRDIEFVRAARDAAGSAIALSVDANGSYRLDVSPGAADDARRLGGLDEFALDYIEQPLPADDLIDHAELARRITTRICLDESLTSTTITREALDMGACSVVCVKAPRYGSWLDAASVLDHCANTGTAAWVGGMLDAGIGRAANLALAAQPGASLPGDLAATARFFTDDVCAPLTVEGPPGKGTMTVPDGPGLGITIDPAAVDRLTTRVETIRPRPGVA